MYDLNLIEEFENDLDYGLLTLEQSKDLISAYKSLIKENIKLQKEVAKLKAFDTSK